MKVSQVVIAKGNSPKVFESWFFVSQRYKSSDGTLLPIFDRTGEGAKTSNVVSDGFLFKPVSKKNRKTQKGKRSRRCLYRDKHPDRKPNRAIVMIEVSGSLEALAPFSKAGGSVKYSLILDNRTHMVVCVPIDGVFRFRISYEGGAINSFSLKVEDNKTVVRLMKKN